MNLYIVRHGESEGNIIKRFQTPDERLTPNGEYQANKLAKRFASLPIDRILASTLVRAQQTAQAIATLKGLSIESDPELVEIRRPSCITGKLHSDPEAKAIARLLATHAEDPDYHHSDEENAWDFMRRVDGVLRRIENKYTDETVVVVTHGHVLHVLLGLLLFGPELHPRQFDVLSRRVKTNNTGITLARYQVDQGWQLITYNDHAHLL